MVDPIARAKELDKADPLAKFRSEFVIDDPDLIYLDGNSLGRMPKRTREAMVAAVDGWGSQLIRGWGENWFDLPQRIGAKLARLIGAQEDEVLVCDSTTVNLYKLVLAALDMQTGRTEIATDWDNFPSDIYVLKGIAERTGTTVVDCKSTPISEKTALLTLSHVTFKRGELNDMASLTELAHRHGAVALWDLSHSVGAVPVRLNELGVDLAVGCTYKYLNGGPGSAAFLYVRKVLQEQLSNPIQGWFGRDSAFDFGLEYRPRKGISRFLVGSPNIFSMIPVEIGIDLVAEAGIENLRHKSLAQTDFLIELFDYHLQALGMTLNTPREHGRRGSHVSLGFEHALALDLALIREMSVIPDYRTPDNVRFGITPLYTTFEEIAEAVMRAKTVLERGLYRKYIGEQPTVT